MNRSKTICALPWTHLNFEPQGKVTPCCLTAHHKYYAGDLNKDSVEDIWNSDNMKALRKQMINGEEPKICSKCFDSEKITKRSSRLHYNNMFPDVYKDIENITAEDGTCSKMELQYWDFRFSNLCNMKCRSCGPMASSLWVGDAKKLGWISEADKLSFIDNVNNTPKIDFLKEQIKYVKRIYFAGGEPLLMKEHWEILDFLIEHERFDVKLAYNTNMSVLEYNGRKAFDYWDKWHRFQIEVWPSIDEIGSRAELIRSGTKWNKVDANLKALSKYENIFVKPNITIGAWNVGRIPEVVDYFCNINIVKNLEWFNFDNFNINIIDAPVHYGLSILPYEYRQSVKDKLQTWIEEYNTKHNTNIWPNLKQVLYHLDDKEQNEKALKKFIKVTADIDRLRKEDFYSTVPELAFLKEENTING